MSERVDRPQVEALAGVGHLGGYEPVLRYPRSLELRRDVFVARLEPSGPPPSGPQVGFAGIGKPWKVERSLEAAGCDLKDFVRFADHHPYSPADLALLEAVAARHDAGLVTTEKDWVRLPLNWRSKVTVWPVRARFEDEAGLLALLHSSL